MGSLAGKSPKDTYKSLLKVADETNGVSTSNSQIEDGKGTATWNSGSNKGDVYVGAYKDGKINGYGKWTNADGSIYHDGMWKDAKPQCDDE